ncbi:hypothetical protein [Lysinibacillus sp. OF-1]|uniref:hypothetical protein n=1 Tax=Lysinibacillus sp. OF-1 TaxID=2972483 RepID=UPI00232DFB32|nr:hypothetical protein [Lysinibacillus sp. OF-1]WCH46401.1 hypothetical protein NV349_15040 [Lysinibacillus sp. OF-1]
MGVIIGGKRLCGKTTDLIKRSNKEWLYIVVANNQHADNIVRLAREMEIDIPYPITFDELPLSPRSKIKGVLIDEIEIVLEQLVHRPIIAASTSYEMIEMDSLIENKGGVMHE